MALPFYDARALRDALDASFGGIGSQNASHAATLRATVHVYLNVLDALASAQAFQSVQRGSAMVGLADYLDLTAVVGAFVRSRLEECAQLGVEEQLIEARSKIQCIKEQVDAHLDKGSRTSPQHADPESAYPSPVTPTFPFHANGPSTLGAGAGRTSSLLSSTNKRRRSPSVEAPRKARWRTITVTPPSPVAHEQRVNASTQLPRDLVFEKLQVFSLGVRDNGVLQSKLQFLGSLVHIDLRVMPGHHLDEVHVDAFFCTPAPRLQTMKYDHVYPAHFPEVWQAPKLLELDCRASQIGTPSPPGSQLEKTLAHVHTFRALAPLNAVGRPMQRQTLARLPHVLRSLSRLVLYSPVRDDKDCVRFEHLERLTVDQTADALWDNDATAQTLTRLAAVTLPGVYVRNGSPAAVRHMLRAPAVVVGLGAAFAHEPGRVVQLEHAGARARWFAGLARDALACALAHGAAANLTFLALAEMMPSTDLRLLFAAPPPPRLEKLEIRIIQPAVEPGTLVDGDPLVSIFEYDSIRYKWGTCHSIVSLGIGTGNCFGQFVDLPAPVVRKADVVRTFIRSVLGAPPGGMAISLRGVLLVESG